MNRMLKEEKGISLVEVLASIVLTTILLMLVSSYFIQSFQQNKHMDKSFSSIQLCQSLLDVYKAKGFDILSSNLGNPKSIQINDELQLDSSTNVSRYSAEVIVIPHPDLPIRVLIVKITVFTKNEQNKTQLEGYVRK